MCVQINFKLILFILFTLVFSSITNAEEVFLSLKKSKVNVSQDYLHLNKDLTNWKKIIRNNY